MVRATSAFALAAVALASVLSASAAQFAFFTGLTGEMQAPTAVVTTSVGAAYILLDDSAMSLKVIVSTNIANIAAAHIHSGAAGTAGPVVLTISNGTMTGTFTTTATISADIIAAMRAGTAYVNVHTAANPNGEIRGQVTPQQSLATSAPAFATAYAAMMSGANEVPAVVTTSAGYGIVLYDSSMMSMVTMYTNVANISASHIHSGAVTASGPVLITVSAAGSKNINQTVMLDAATVTAISGGNAYLNLHTAANPGGEIRGQLMSMASLLGVTPSSTTSASSTPTMTSSKPGSAGRNAIGAAGLFVAAAVLVLA